jgi:hypothetical protein
LTLVLGFLRQCSRKPHAQIQTPRRS